MCNVCVRMLLHRHGGQRTTLWSPFSHSTFMVSRNRTQAVGLTRQALSLRSQELVWAPFLLYWPILSLVGKDSDMLISFLTLTNT